MTYQRFEDLPVWQEAARLYEETEVLLEEAGFRASNAYRDQLERAALSVTNNIAEGFERGTTKELLSFLYIARGSAGEVRSMLIVKRRGVKEGKPAATVARMVELGESCSRQLRAWADALQNSEIKGPRYLTHQAREDAARKRATL
jgi:four helix bundle protein